jgi:hypothetical protein
MMKWIETGIACAVVAGAILLAAAAGSESRPDFNDHDAVVAAINDLTANCGGDALCVATCKASAEAAPKFQAATPINRRLRQNLWHACNKKQPASAPVAQAEPQPQAAPESQESAAPETAPATQAGASAQAGGAQGRFVIAGLTLGGSIQDVMDRITLMDADGYYKSEKRERGSGGFRWQGSDTEGQLPDIIETYKARIDDKTQRVYIYFEAAGDGTIYKIDFEQKGGAIDPEAANQAVIERFGEPDKVAGMYLYWGCENENLDVCVKASATEFVFEIFAQDVRIKNAWRPVYADKVAEARGAKPGLQF